MKFLVSRGLPYVILFGWLVLVGVTTLVVAVGWGSSLEESSRGSGGQQPGAVWGYLGAGVVGFLAGACVLSVLAVVALLELAGEKLTWLRVVVAAIFPGFLVALLFAAGYDYWFDSA